MGRMSGRWRPSPVTILLLGMALALAGNMATNTVDPPDAWRWWPWAVWAVVGLLMAASMAVQYAQPRHGPGGPHDQVVADLAARLERSWSAEAARREVTRPAPLVVSWSSTGRPAAGRDVVLDDPLGGDWQQFPLAGQTDLPRPGSTGPINQQIVAAFRRLPHRQLVVLGEPGAGKSVFALLLTLGLIRTRDVGGGGGGTQLPVLLAINGWDPAEPVDVFVARRLSEDYADVLAAYGPPRSVADRLVEHNQVLPVLDGLDELPDRVLGPAVTALNDYAAAGGPLVVTSRSGEYEKMVARTDTILTTAAVVELEPVTPAAAIAFLSYPERARPRWEPVFDHLRREPPSSPLTQAFATPLMVALARTAYREPGTDPGELLDLPSVEAVTGRLMDAFVTAVHTGPAPGSRPGRLRRAPTYPAGRARRWLSCLAYDLYQSGARDLHWWKIAPDLLAARWAWVLAMTEFGVPVLMAALIAGPVGAVTGVGWLLPIMAGVLIMGVAASGRLRPLWPHGYPPYTRVTFRNRKQRRIERIVLALAYGGAGGFLTGLITTTWPGTTAGRLLHLLTAVAAGLVYGLATVVLPAWRPALPTRRVTPTTTLGHNRRIVAAAACQHALTGGAVLALAATLIHTSPVTTGLTAAIVYGATAGLVAGGWGWIRFRLTHARLALRGWLPWRLHRFLADAHRRGVLRRAGPVYQFRHAILQDHLAQALHPHQLRARFDVGDHSAVKPLAELLVGQGRVDEAIEVLRPTADDGNYSEAQRLAELLVGQGRVDEVRTRADAGDRAAGERLAGLLAEQDRVDELRGRADAGDVAAAVRLTEVLAERGRVDEAIEVLRAPADAHDHSAGERLAGLLAEHGRVDELRARADAGDFRAMLPLAELLRRLGRVDELRARADGYDLYAGGPLAELLAEQGRVDELRARADAGDLWAGGPLARLLAEQGRVDELRARADAGDRFAVGPLATALADQGRVDELRGRADAGDVTAAAVLSTVLAEQGRVDEAIAILRARADSDGHNYDDKWLAAEWLVGLLDREGRVDEAIEVLRPWSGRPAAAELMARLSAERKRHPGR
ncbi:hypothetical protein NIE79_004724 [Micromonospora sp. NIE79]|uniref:NACHT domain-containing protein n=1 Tax=Micromonospora trifolii TaxID=2911208 RepID=A0ABS9N873_9ACTN|nr:hypothetical protein [Micromonospora trifolii]MCG5446157.1 hypothetical protein [Micromonospora trifolii]